MALHFPTKHQNYSDEYFELDENDMMETQLVDETAWDLFTSISKPQHDIYSVGDQTKETIPIITNVLEQHGLYGLNTADIIEIIGNKQCGKTQLLYQYVINCCLPSKITVIKSSKNNKPTILELGGHHSKSIFFDLNLSFDVDRLYDIFKTQIKRKITKHNTRLDTRRAQHMNEPDIQHEPCLETMVEIDARKFLQYEAKKLWKLLYSKISLVQPCSPIQFIVSLHKLRSMLNAMYTSGVNTNNNHMHGHGDEYTNGDNGMRLILIDDINAFFNELTANKERDKYYNSISSLLMDLCNEFGLIIFFTRYTQFRSEKEWLKKLLPLLDIKMRKKNNSFQLKPQEMFHKRFGKIELENKAIFVIYLYRETMEYFDSTVTHPAISNDLFLCNTGNDNEYDYEDDESYLERKLYLTGDDEITRKWVLMQSGKYLDPVHYTKRKQKDGNKKIFGKEDYNIIRGVVVTQPEFIHKVKKNINEHGYDDVILQRKMIKFHATISQQTGFVYHIQ